MAGPFDARDQLTKLQSLAETDIASGKIAFGLPAVDSPFIDELRSMSGK